MKWRHWSILIILVLLNYIIFSTAFTQLAKQRQVSTLSTRTPQPTFADIASTPAAWIVLPTSTLRPTRTPITPTPTLVATFTPQIVETTTITSTTLSPASIEPTPTNTPAPPTATATPEPTTYTVQPGDTLSEIAKQHNVDVQVLLDANGLSDPNRIVVGQILTIPAGSEAAPSSNNQEPTAKPTAKPPTPKPTKKPPTATPVVKSLQFSGEVIWDPMVAPNCAGPGISKQSIIRDAGGNPLNGIVIEVDCYGNKWQSHPTGNPGEYDAGHYDFAFGQSSPQDWTCSIYILSVNGQPVSSSERISVHFDTNACQPNGTGHQVAIVNWTKNW